MRRPQLNALLIVGLVAAFLLGLLLPQLQLGGTSEELQSGLLLSQPRPLRAWEEALIDQDGADFSLPRFQGRSHLLFFGFRSCPDICPNTLLTAARAYRQLPTEQQQKLGVVFISVDPGRDTPENLASYVRAFHPDFEALTGPLASLENLAGQAGIAFMQVEQEDSYTIDHSAALVLLDAQARIQAYFAPPLDAVALGADLARLLP